MYNSIIDRVLGNIMSLVVLPRVRCIATSAVSTSGNTTTDE